MRKFEIIDRDTFIEIYLMVIIDDVILPKKGYY